MSAQQKKHPFDFKTQYGLGFNQQDDEIVVDFFCGGGGAGTALQQCLTVAEQRVQKWLIALGGRTALQRVICQTFLPCSSQPQRGKGRETS